MLQRMTESWQTSDFYTETPSKQNAKKWTAQPRKSPRPVLQASGDELGDKAKFSWKSEQKLAVSGYIQITNPQTYKVRLRRGEDGQEMFLYLKFIKFILPDTVTHSVGNKYRWLYTTLRLMEQAGWRLSLTQIYFYYSL